MGVMMKGLLSHLLKYTLYTMFILGNAIPVSMAADKENSKTAERQEMLRLTIEQPFEYTYQAGSIEKAAFDYALVARTQNLELLKTFYTQQALDFRNKRFGGIGDDTWLPKADYSKLFKIKLRPHILRAENYHIEIHYYHSEKHPDFTTVTEMKLIDGVWKVVN